MRYTTAEIVIATISSVLCGIVLVGIFVWLGLMAIDTLPDPQQPVTLVVTPTK